MTQHVRVTAADERNEDPAALFDCLFARGAHTQFRLHCTRFASIPALWPPRVAPVVLLVPTPTLAPYSGGTPTTRAVQRRPSLRALFTDEAMVFEIPGAVLVLVLP